MDKSRDKILIVDDEPIVRTALIDDLSSKDYQIIESENGKDALKKVKNLIKRVIGNNKTEKNEI